jgi:hypothetical protein
LANGPALNHCTARRSRKVVPAVSNTPDAPARHSSCRYVRAVR